MQRKFKRDHGLDYPLDQICVANGGKQVIFNAFMATVNEGDEVVIPAPYWGAYPLMTKLLGGTPVFVTCPQNNGFKLRPEDLDAAITPRTKLADAEFPEQPVRRRLLARGVAALADVLLRHPHVWIMSDDMYEHLRLRRFRLRHDGGGGAEAARPRADLSGVSKTYAMTGWRIGFAAGPKDLIRAMVNMQGQATAGVSSVGQAAAAAALDGPQDEVPKMRESYRRRRDLSSTR